MLYTDHINSIEISYPHHVVAQKKANQRYLLPPIWSALSDGARKGSALIVNFPFTNRRTQQYSLYATVSIGKSTNPYDVKNCYRVNGCMTNACKLPDATINGRTFHVFKVQSAGMSHYVIGKSYRYRLGNTCYALESLMSGFNQSNGKALAKLQAHYAKQMQTTINSFKFTGNFQKK